MNSDPNHRDPNHLDPNTGTSSQDLAAADVPTPFPIVGIGASAGGLAAFEAFFSAIPQDTATGLAFVLVQHLAPDHKSMLTDLVKRYTPMQVREVEDGMTISPNCAYIIPPNLDMALFQGKLHLLKPAAPRGLRLPIDFFFRSLADDQHERAICVVLSGTGSDGTLGARAIKGCGGLVIAQTPDTAAYDGMPRSVIANGLADMVLSPTDMPKRLIAYLSQALGHKTDIQIPAIQTEDALTKICLLLRDATRHDFSQYKKSTLVRRIERRMALNQIDQQSDYVHYLQQEPEEIQELFHDFLIGVTNFFRDPEAFAVLETVIIPKLFAHKPTGSNLRFWVCGCSSGEEAYSIAILVQEHMASLNQSFQVQIFATDVDARAIVQARAGTFPPNIAADISPERLRRFFTLDPENGVYRIAQVIRDLLVFSEQDLIRDPPFSRIDLISCRNLLIYLDSNLQRRVIPMFHYALNPNGALFLGSSESIGDSLMLFTALDRKWKLYSRLDAISGPPAPTIDTITSRREQDLEMPLRSHHNSMLRKPSAVSDPRTLTESALLGHFNAVAVLTNSTGTVGYIHGRTGKYLEPAIGTANMDIFEMAREGLRRPLTAALQRAVSRQEVVQVPKLRVKTNGDFAHVDVCIRPVKSGSSSESSDGRAEYYLIVFEPVPEIKDRPRPPVITDADADGDATPNPAQNLTKEPGERGERGEPDQPDSPPTHKQAQRRIAELEQDLQGKEEYLQATLEEMETSNEELKSTNEEMQSVNEELQSTNEELETSKEELQSVNEELATVNVELQTKVADLSRANDDMNNLLAGTGVATLFVDDQLRISRFTPIMTKIIKLIPGDIGRPVGDIASNLIGYAEFEEDIHVVLQTLVPKEKAVQTADDAWLLMRIGPYRTLNNVIEGAVMTFVDITSRKRMEDELRNARTFSERVVDAVREPLAILDSDSVLISANRAFYRHFQVTESETLGRSLFELGNGQWDNPALRKLVKTLQDTDNSVEDYRIEHEFPRLGRRVMQINARRLSPVSEPGGRILLAFEDLGVGKPDTPHTPE